MSESGKSDVIGWALDRRGLRRWVLDSDMPSSFDRLKPEVKMALWDALEKWRKALKAILDKE